MKAKKNIYPIIIRINQQHMYRCEKQVLDEGDSHHHFPPHTVQLDFLYSKGALK